MFRDLSVCQTWQKMGDDVLHIELGKWADVFVIAPLSANSLAKISNGLCDNLLVCTCLHTQLVGSSLPIYLSLLYNFMFR